MDVIKSRYIKKMHSVHHWLESLEEYTCLTVNILAITLVQFILEKNYPYEKSYTPETNYAWIIHLDVNSVLRLIIGQNSFTTDSSVSMS